MGYWKSSDDAFSNFSILFSSIKISVLSLKRLAVRSDVNVLHLRKEVKLKSLTLYTIQSVGLHSSIETEEEIRNIDMDVNQLKINKAKQENVAEEDEEDAVAEELGSPTRREIMVGVQSFNNLRTSICMSPRLLA
ncbi:hypothetical protein ACJMK2_020992 [Sinanodonta woodiana]|uniref:Uncharacterized protein n=1 Tax=Sinanodonta woodiana TaxID=1069815 RepID=A0ABD3U184_SINWO